ncbi:hypothetical protein [Aquimarina agarivorans]|uniref:hypothetical protein n=1 Tax=Aquimarina agarivorans TaxID=980584 RepID=UPI001EE67C47|nr:hypothetical protein [Aquimarina agarivorans]
MKRCTIILFMFLSNLLLGQTVTRNDLMRLPVGSTTSINNLPMTTADEGQIIFNSTLKKIFEYNGTEWKQLLEDRLTPVVVPLTASYTLINSNNTNVLTFDSATDITLTIPTGLPIGYNISIYQIGDGQVTITGAGGVQIKNRLSRFKTAGRDAGVGIISTATNIFHITGDLKL